MSSSYMTLKYSWQTQLHQQDLPTTVSDHLSKCVHRKGCGVGALQSHQLMMVSSGKSEYLKGR